MARLWRPHTGTHLGMMVLIYTRSNGRCGVFSQHINKNLQVFFKDEIGLTDDQELKLTALLYDEQSSVDASTHTLKNWAQSLAR